MSIQYVHKKIKMFEINIRCLLCDSMFNRLNCFNCFVAKLHDRELIGTGAGIEVVVGHRVVVGVIDGGEVVINDVQRRPFTAR